MSHPELIVRAEALAASVAELNESVRNLAVNQARLRMATRWIVAGLLLGLAFTLVAVALFVQQQQADDRLSDNTARIEQIQARTSDEVLCPLYALLLEFRDRSISNPTLTPQERRDRELAYEVINHGHATLGCR